LSDNSDLPRLHVVLKAPRIMRCRWCGIDLSDSSSAWNKSLYCSSECMIYTEGYTFTAFIGFTLLFLFVLFLISGVSLLVTFAPVGLIILVFIQVKKMKNNAPQKGSRANGQPSDMSLLKSRLPFVKCPKCHENLNLSTIADDKVFHCQYCDATGVIEIEIAGNGIRF